MLVKFHSKRLQFSLFQMSDAEDVFKCITPAVTKFMAWEPPQSWGEYKDHCEKRLQSHNPNDFSFVIRRRDSHECLGLTALEDADMAMPEIGIWLKENAQGQGFGKEAIKALIEWAFQTLGKENFAYPVAIQNIGSRCIAEGLHGEIVGNRKNPKYEAVVYRICSNPSLDC